MVLAATLAGTLPAKLAAEVCRGFAAVEIMGLIVVSFVPQDLPRDLPRVLPSMRFDADLAAELFAASPTAISAGTIVARSAAARRRYPSPRHVPECRDMSLQLPRHLSRASLGITVRSLLGFEYWLKVNSTPTQTKP